MTSKYLLFLWSSLIAIKVVVNGSITVMDVPAGHLAILPCHSIDDHHRFMFWQLRDDKHIIGPGNPHDENKYNYEVLTGKLYIRGVSTAEAGFYKCYSKGVTDSSAFNMQTIELIVSKDWEEVWESDFETNLLRGMAVVMVIVVAVAIILLIIIVKKKRNHRFFEMDESRESSPTKYTGNIQSIPMPPTVSAPTTSGIDNAGLDVDFPKVFQQMQKEQVIP